MLAWLKPFKLYTAWLALCTWLQYGTIYDACLVKAIQALHGMASFMYMASVQHCLCTWLCIDFTTWTRGFYICACVHPCAWQICLWLLYNKLIGHSCIYLDLEYSNLVWGEEVLTLLCPPAGEEPHLALPELIQKVCNMYECMRAYLSSNAICTCMQPPLHAFTVSSQWLGNHYNVFQGCSLHS